MWSKGLTLTCSGLQTLTPCLEHAKNQELRHKAKGTREAETSWRKQQHRLKIKNQGIEKHTAPHACTCSAVAVPHAPIKTFKVWVTWNKELDRGKAASNTYLRPILLLLTDAKNTATPSGKLSVCSVREENNTCYALPLDD
eukprot:scaffold23073_cov25-Tisochrysis_lutea.AAC.1